MIPKLLQQLWQNKTCYEQSFFLFGSFLIYIRNPLNVYKGTFVFPLQRKTVS